MNRFDQEFWNGFLKGLNAAQFELNEMEEKSKKGESDGIRISIATLKELKEKVEKLHSEDILMFLRQYR
jgi:hypothetical protein